jgi:hypothetical protein
MNDRQKYLSQLRQAWQERNLVLFLGAGISMPHGIPNWNSLVIELLLGKERQFQEFWPNYQVALVEWLAKTYDFSPLALSRVFKYRGAEDRNDWTADDQERYLKRVRKALYRNRTLAAPDRDSLAWVAELILKSGTDHGVRAIITANFDDLLEQRLRRRVNVTSVYDETQLAAQGLRVVHVHGYLPDAGKIPRQEIVFAEDEYNALTYTMFHWAQVELVSLMQTSTLLFIGFSMTDPNVRRLLDATRPRDRSIRHFAMKKDYVMNGSYKDTISDIRRRARQIDQSLSKKDPHVVQEGIELALERAREYDDELLSRMGVGVLWMKEFTDIRQILDQISA